MINYQHVSITFPITIRVALQKDYEYNKLPNCTSGTTQCYKRCLKPSYERKPSAYTLLKTDKMSMFKSKVGVFLYVVNIHPFTNKQDVY